MTTITVKTSTLEQNANRLVELQEEVKAKEAEIEKLKAELKKELKDGTYELSGAVVTIATQMRESINKDALIEAYGISTISKFTKITEYRVLICKKSIKAA